MTDKIKQAIRSGKLIPLEKFMDKFSPEDQAWIHERARYLQAAMAIRKLRQKSLLTQQELADRMHVDRELITRAESGQQNITLETLYRIAEAADKNVSITFT